MDCRANVRKSIPYKDQDVGGGSLQKDESKIFEYKLFGNPGVL